MNYTINYTEQGRILGFAKGDTDLNIEVSNTKWVEAQSYNKIIIDGKNIAFEKVDWRTTEEIRNQEQIKFRTQRDNLLNEADIEINKLDDNFKDSSKWREYRQALRDAAISWKLPIMPPKEV